MRLSRQHQTQTLGGGELQVFDELGRGWRLSDEPELFADTVIEALHALSVTDLLSFLEQLTKATVVVAQSGESQPILALLEGLALGHLLQERQNWL